MKEISKMTKAELTELLVSKQAEIEAFKANKSLHKKNAKASSKTVRDMFANSTESTAYELNKLIMSTTSKDNAVSHIELASIRQSFMNHFKYLKSTILKLKIKSFKKANINYYYIDFSNNDMYYKSDNELAIQDFRENSYRMKNS